MINETEFADTDDTDHAVATLVGVICADFWIKCQNQWTDRNCEQAHMHNVIQNGYTGNK